MAGHPANLSEFREVGSQGTLPPGSHAGPSDYSLDSNFCRPISKDGQRREETAENTPSGERFPERSRRGEDEGNTHEYETNREQDRIPEQHKEQ
jgi:hypothetical protein